MQPSTYFLAVQVLLHSPVCGAWIKPSRMHYNSMSLQIPRLICIARLENIRDIDKILNNMAWDTLENGSAQWEYSVVNPRLGPARQEVSELNLQIDQVEAEMKSIPDIDYSEAVNRVNSATLRSTEASMRYDEVRVGVRDPDLVASAQVEKLNSLLELRLANEDRALAHEYNELIEKKYMLQSDLFEQEQQVAYWEAKLENQGAEEFEWIMRGEERKLLERLYKGNGTLTEDFAEQWSKLLSPLDSLKNDINIERNQLLTQREAVNRPGSTWYDIEDLKNQEILVDALEERAREMEAVLQENGVDASMSSSQSLNSILEKGLARARINGRVGVATRNMENATLVERAQLWLKGGRVVESGEEAFTIGAEIEAMESGVWNVAALSVLESFNPFSLGMNILNIYFVYLSIESLEDQLAQSEVVISAQLAFSNPNLQTMVQYYVSNQAITYGQEFMQQTIAIYPEVGRSFDNAYSGSHKLRYQLYDAVR